MLETPLKIALRNWQAQGVCFLPPATAQHVEAVFRACGSPLSNDVRELYALIGGFEYGEYCGLNWSLWSPTRILEENLWNHGPRVWFSDADISAQIYGLDYRNAEVSPVYYENTDCHENSYQVANSLAGFFDRCVNDPDSLNLSRIPDPPPRHNFIEKLRWFWNATWHADAR
jgi:hypothetical protein